MEYFILHSTKEKTWNIPSYLISVARPKAISAKQKECPRSTVGISTFTFSCTFWKIGRISEIRKIVKRNANLYLYYLRFVYYLHINVLLNLGANLRIIFKIIRFWLLKFKIIFLQYKFVIMSEKRLFWFVVSLVIQSVSDL